MGLGKISVFLALVAGTAAYATEPNEATKRKTVTSRYYVDNAIATKQGKLAGNGNSVAVTYPNSLGGTPTTRTINIDLGTSTSDTSLAETGAINTALNNKQGKLTGAADTVITYGANAGVTGSKAVYQSSGSYNANALAEVGHVNTTIQNGFNAHLSCVEYVTQNDPTSGCLLWNVNQLSGTYVPHGN
ncbi:MAG: hypothetical protein J6Y07_02185 [Alphaproteobacteria bacterium]|nr:hypothetical protein [Alphaproteobacteria bacterium]